MATIKDNEGYGLRFSTSSNVYIWNNTVLDNDDTDIVLDSSSSAYSIGTAFSTISVSSDSIYTQIVY